MLKETFEKLGQLLNSPKKGGIQLSQLFCWDSVHTFAFSYFHHVITQHQALNRCGHQFYLGLWLPEVFCFSLVLKIHFYLCICHQCMYTCLEIPIEARRGQQIPEARVACDCRSSDRVGRSELCKHRKGYKELSNLSNPNFSTINYPIQVVLLQQLKLQRPKREV